MSYILEALKKAQAERQIGSTPTIHAATLASTPAGQGARGKRTPVIVAMALMATAIAGLAAMLLRQPPAASQPQLATPAPAASQQQVAAQAPATAALPAIATTSNGAAQTAPAAAPLAARSDAGPPIAANPAAPAPAATERVAVQAAAPAQTAPQPRTPLQSRTQQAAAALPAAEPRRVDASAAPAPMPAAAPAATPAQAAAPAPAPVEEQVQSLRELPEPIQRAIPQIALGGYMYSKNPADRLLLIDKVLRREGEEVAPGLILEKLQPKQAIFGFRGYRYRVPL